MSFVDFIKNIKRFGLEYYGLWYGVYRGVVSELDVENRCRLKVIVPGTGNDGTPLSAWAYPVFPFAGNGYGWYQVPKVKDTVWIMFEGGRLQNPIWIGGWYGKDELPTAFRDKQDNAVGIVTPHGHNIVIDETSDTITVTHHADDGDATVVINGGIITLSSKHQDEITIGLDTISVVDSNQNSIVMDSTGCEIKTSSGDKVDMNNGSMKIETKTALEISSTGKVDINSGIININGSGQQAVLGNNLYTWLSTLYGWAVGHVHLTTTPTNPTSPSTVPLKPPTPDMLSVKVKLG